MSTIEISNTAREYRSIQAMIKELESEADALKQEMIREMDSQQVEELAAGEFTIRYTLIESNRLDSAKLKATQPEIYDAYTKRTTSTRFMVA